MADVFFLKYRDTFPVLQVTLENPDGTTHDLTAAISIRLLIYLADGTRLIRDMVKGSPGTSGIATYAWVDGDWGNATGTLVDGAYPTGGLVGVTAFPPQVGTSLDHLMEYEVVNASSRLTFPNGGYHKLRILRDLGQGA